MAGGGWYGGYANKVTNSDTNAGQGGSGYIDGVQNGSTTNGVHTGNGTVKITYMGSDSTPPTGALSVVNPKMTIEGDQATNSRDITLQITAHDDDTGIKRISLINENDTSLNWINWDDSSLIDTASADTKTKEWTLSDEDGHKTVYLVIEDNTGNATISPITETFTITYDSKGGLDGPENEIKIKDVPYTISSVIPTKSGMAFVGWDTESSGETVVYVNGDSYIDNADLTLYAVWEEDTGSASDGIIYSAENTLLGNGIFTNGTTTNVVSYYYPSIEYSQTSNIVDTDGNADGTYSSNSDETVPVTIEGVNALRVNIYYQTETNQDFIEIYAGSGVVGSPSIRLSGNDNNEHFMENPETYVFEGNTITFRFTSNDRNEYYGYFAIIEPYGDEGPIAMQGTYEEPTLNNKIFAGWANNNDATIPDYFTEEEVAYHVEEGHIVYAVWAETEYQVTYNQNTTDTVTNMPSSQTKNYGVPLTLSSNVPVRTGYTFKGWATIAFATVAEYAAGGTFNTNADTVLYAVWSISTPPNAPILTVSSGTVGTNNWYRSNVGVTITQGADTGSGISRLTYLLSGKMALDETTIANNGIATISAEGETTITAYAYNDANVRSEPATLTLKIDKTSPTTAEVSGWKFNNASVNRSRGIVSVNISAIDNLSGIDHIAYTSSTNGNVWTNATLTSGYATIQINPGTNVSFRIKAVDKAGNESGVAYATNFGKVLAVCQGYNHYLGRAPEYSGLMNWVNITNMWSVYRGFIDSTEGQGKNYNNTQFVQKLYLMVMGRQGDSGGINTFVSQLNGGTTRLSVLTQLLDSPEYSAIETAWGFTHTAPSDGGGGSTPVNPPEPAHTHSPSNWQSGGPNFHNKWCLTCGTLLDSASHSWQTSGTGSGYIDQYCTICGQVRRVSYGS